MAHILGDGDIHRIGPINFVQQYDDEDLRCQVKEVREMVLGLARGMLKAVGEKVQMADAVHIYEEVLHLYDLGQLLLTFDQMQVRADGMIGERMAALEERIAVLEGDKEAQG